MIENIKTSLLSVAGAFIASIGGAIVVNSNGHGVYAHARKTLSL